MKTTRTTITLRDDLHQCLKAEAVRLRVSLGQVMELYLIAGVQSGPVNDPAAAAVEILKERNQRSE